MPRQPIDPKRAQLLELTDQIGQHLNQLRDFGSTPGNVWLAKSELQILSTLLVDIDSLLEEIRADDQESGY